MNRRNFFYLLVIPFVTLAFSSIFLLNLDSWLPIAEDNFLQDKSSHSGSYSTAVLFGASKQDRNANNKKRKTVTDHNSKNNNMKESINNFSKNLFMEVYRAAESDNGSGRNTLISGFSVYMALLMTSNGAKGATLEEMTRTLCIGDKSSTLANKEVKEILSELKNKKNSRYLGIGNGLFIKNDYQVEPNFLSLTKDTFSSEVALLDFLDSEPARQHINNWVELQTQKMIQNLLPQGSITGLTKMVLVNAIYFKAKWKAQFEARLTKTVPFYASAQPDSVKQVPTMHLHGQKFGIGQSNVARWIHLPYVGDEFAMVIILPAQRFDLSNARQQLLAGRIPIHRVTHTKVDTLAVPKFKFTHEVRMKEILQSMGIQQAFSHSGSDFSRMTKANDIYIDQVYHKAFIQVDEMGTKAAAATAVVMNLRSVAMVQKTDFIVDQPFLFSIVHTPSNITLFQGQVVDPLV